MPLTADLAAQQVQVSLQKLLYLQGRRQPWILFNIMEVKYEQERK